MKKIAATLLVLSALVACTKYEESPRSNRNVGYLQSFIHNIYNRAAFIPVSALSELGEEELNATEFKPLTVNNDYSRCTITRIEPGAWAARTEDRGIKCLTLIYMLPETHVVMDTVRHDWQVCLPSGEYEEDPYSCQFNTVEDIVFGWRITNNGFGVYDIRLVAVSGSFYGATFIDGKDLDWGEFTFKKDGTSTFRNGIGVKQ